MPGKNRIRHNLVDPDYKRIVENSFDAIFLVRGRRFVYANPMFTNLTGYTAADLARDDFDLTRMINQKSIKLVKQEYRARLKGESSSYHYSIDIIARNGDQKEIELRTMPIGQGSEIYVMGIARDITERRRMEADIIYLTNFQNLLMKLGKSFINCPANKTTGAINSALEEIGKFTRVDRVYIFEYDFDNNACSNTFEWCGKGISPQMENLKKISLSTIPTWVSSHKNGKLIKINRLSELSQNDVVRQILEAQEIRSLITIPMIDDSSCLGFVGFDSVKKAKSWGTLEISLLKLFSELLTNLNVKNNYEISLRKATDKARESDRLKSAFLANLSHEIRTPMNCIVGFSALIKRKKPEGEKLERYIDIINSNADHLLGLINDIIDISKIESGQIDIIDEHVEVGELFRELSDMFQVTNTEVDIRFRASDNPVFLTDRIKLKQVLVNLIGNAVKFTTRGYIEISLKTEDGNLIFSVADTGPGIQMKDRAGVFKRFVKGTGGNWQSRSGTGLGLAIVKAYVEAMGGEVWFHSRLKKGSTFYFSLPLRSE